MTEHSNSTADETNDDKTAPIRANAPAPKLLDDSPRARPDCIDTATPGGMTHTSDHYEVATSGPFAGIAREDLDAPAVLFHVVEDANGDRAVEVRHRDAAIPAGVADRLVDYFAGFYDLDHPEMKPGVLVAIYEDLQHPDHGGPHITEASAKLGPNAALRDPTTAPSASGYGDRNGDDEPIELAAERERE